MSATSRPAATFSVNTVTAAPETDILPLLKPAIVREIFRLMTHPPIDDYVTYGLARQANNIILATVATLFASTVSRLERGHQRGDTSADNYAGWNPAPATSIAQCVMCVIPLRPIALDASRVVRHDFTKLRALGAPRRPQSSPRPRPRRPVRDRTSPTAKMPGQLVASGCDNAWSPPVHRRRPIYPFARILVVQGDAVEPLGVRRGPEHEKHIWNVAGLRLTGNSIAPRDGVEVALAVERGDLGVRMHGDAFGRRLDAADEVVGHVEPIGRRAPGCAHGWRDVTGRPRPAPRSCPRQRLPRRRLRIARTQRRWRRSGSRQPSNRSMLARGRLRYAHQWQGRRCARALGCRRLIRVCTGVNRSPVAPPRAAR